MITNAPQLRFPEFTDEWQEKRIQEILIHYKLGGNYSNTEEKNNNPLMKMGNLGRGNFCLDKIEYIKKENNINKDDLIKENDLFFNTRNTLDLVGKVAIWKNELPRAYYNSNLMRINFKSNQFMNYYLNSYKGLKSLRRVATGTTSVAAIYTRDLLHIKLYIPTLPEQQKIAGFLRKVDEKIEGLEKKYELFSEYKKGVMRKIFSQEIRFKNENGKQYPDWEEKKISEIFEISNWKDKKCSQ